jgi:hypothetical protein
MAAGDGPIVVNGQVVTNGVIIPLQLDMLTRRFGTSGLSSPAEVIPGDPDEWPVYWLLRRYYTSLPDPTVASVVEPIRAKVESTQDLSLLTDDERVMARQLNALYNTDYDQTGFATTTVPSVSP